MNTTRVTRSTSGESLTTGESYVSLLSKVPEVTIYFWIIKVLCTTVGETASDFLNVNLGFGLNGTSVVMGILLAIVLLLQLKAQKYIPSIYWSAVILISVFGTLVTDILTDNLNVPLTTSTIVFSAALGLTFAAWYAKEKTLSIHSIFTRKRECFYWLAILFTFALGTAVGDLMAESLGLGYLVTGIIVVACIVSITTAWKLGLDPVLSFWVAYILTRPLGASLGDYLSQSTDNGGLGLGAMITSAVFISAIIAVVLFLSITKRDTIAVAASKPIETAKQSYAGIFQTGVVLGILVIASCVGYYWRTHQLQNQALAHTSSSAPLGDLSSFRNISADTLALVNAGNLPAAKTRVGDLEYDWDNAEAHMRPMNAEKWAEMDDSIDEVLHTLRARHPDANACTTSLKSLLSLIAELNGKTIKPMHVSGVHENNTF